MARLPRSLAALCLYSSLPHPAGSLLSSVGIITRRGLPVANLVHRSRDSSRTAPPSMAARAQARTAEPVEDPAMARLLEDLKAGDRLKGVVVAELDGTTGKKAWVRLGVARKGKKGKTTYVDGMIRLSREKGLKPKKIRVDEPVTVYVKKVVNAEGRLEVGLRPPKPKKPVVDTSNLAPLANLNLGDELQGTVKSVTQFAAFVSCGVGRPTRRLRADGKPMVMEPVDGFLGSDDLPSNVALSAQLVKSQDTDVIISEGDRVTVFVKAVYPSNGRFRVTLDADITSDKVRQMRNMAERQRGKFSRRREVADLEVGRELLGEIVKAADYGFFVDVGAKGNGLVHISSISDKENRYLGDLRTFARVGDKIYVRVDGVDEQGRLSLSYEAREQDRPRLPNRRERRAEAKQGEQASPQSSGAATDNRGEDDSGGFLADPSKTQRTSKDDQDDSFDIFSI